MSRQIKRFLVFTGDAYKTCPAWYGFRGDRDTIEEAIQLATDGPQYIWIQLVDLEERSTYYGTSSTNIMNAHWQEYIPWRADTEDLDDA